MRLLSPPEGYSCQPAISMQMFPRTALLIAELIEVESEKEEGQY